jgi:hypothetical protein
MGGADLLLLEEVIVERWKKYGVTSEEFNEKIELTGFSCSDACRQPDKKPPFALVNDTLIPEATIGLLLEHIEPLFLSDREEIEDGR